MLGKRITEPRLYISLYDPALQEAGAMDAAKYRVTRDVADLGDWKAWPTQPTVFTLAPLEAGYGHLADDMGFLARRNIFSLHVTKVDNFDDGGEPLQWETINGQRSIATEGMARFGDEIVDEIATVVVELAQSDTTGFTLPDGYRDFLRNTLTRRAILARSTDSASEPSSD
jgi:hypothetical protein